MSQVLSISFIDGEPTNQSFTIQPLYESEELQVVFQTASANISYEKFFAKDLLGEPRKEDIVYGGVPISIFYFPVYPIFGQDRMVWIKFADSATSANYSLTVTQNATVISALWKDKNILEGITITPFSFRLIDERSGQTYTYTTYVRPDGTYQEAIFNDLIAQLFPRPVIAYPSEGDGLSVTESQILRKVVVRNVPSVNSGVEIASFLFKNDWSYDNSGRNVASEPIRNEIGKRQLLLSTILDSGHLHAMVVLDNQGNEIGRETFSLDSIHGEDAAIWVSDLLVSYPNASRVELRKEASSYDVALTSYALLDDECFSHAIYYINAYGGWDSLLVKGNSKKTDAYTRATMRRKYDNSDAQARGIYNYANEIEEQWEFQSGWLSDDDASRMHHLLGSTSVYMMDLMTKTFTPVVLTNSDCQYKSFKGEGLRVVNYAITARVARDKVRR